MTRKKPRRGPSALSLLLVSLLGGLAVSCAPPLGPGALESATLRLRMPPLPEAWRETLGDCSWSLSWFGPDGSEERADGVSSTYLIEVRIDAVTPILAYPSWPRLGIPPGALRPAGAVYPHGISFPEVPLDWVGGVSAVFYGELLRAGGEEGTAPSLFDWPRFRDLLLRGELKEEVRTDPWRVDWASVARATRRAGFDRRRLVPVRREVLVVPSPAPGPWVLASPFAGLLRDSPEGTLSLEASDGRESAFSPWGDLVFSRSLWAWFPRDPAGLLASSPSLE